MYAKERRGNFLGDGDRIGVKNDVETVKSILLKHITTKIDLIIINVGKVDDKDKDIVFIIYVYLLFYFSEILLFYDSFNRTNNKNILY